MNSVPQIERSDGVGMRVGENLLERIGLANTQPRPRTSQARFPDGGAWRIEIPSVEGPDVLRAVLDGAARLEVRFTG